MRAAIAENTDPDKNRIREAGSERAARVHAFTYTIMYLIAGTFTWTLVVLAIETWGPDVYILFLLALIMAIWTFVVSVVTNASLHVPQRTWIDTTLSGINFISHLLKLVLAQYVAELMRYLFLAGVVAVQEGVLIVIVIFLTLIFVAERIVHDYVNHGIDRHYKRLYIFAQSSM